ncbi:hypothetical protein [Billgrantia aerodenitrificans]|uniref:Uncharacterized protein n=1 Tax=Billgrantia aerodenitrificans TaxID=2733483 RepID=A0ABS9ANX8_9GAMM|nr:hypothetical protein [Halomonas aerodenitrificans]MCE8023288.1 hypothetical protein [Halomonas aerodenitrificans]
MMIWVRVFFAAMLISPSILSHAATVQSADALDLLLKSNIVNRDSGEEVTRRFLSECLSKEGPARYRLECDDVLFVYHISYFDNISGQSEVALITEDGVSVENRWVFEVGDGVYVDVTEKIWPTITENMIGKLLVQETGDSSYTAEYIRGVAHSSYRISYGADTAIMVGSGIPDVSYGVELGRIVWDGREFVFLPNRR